MQPTLAPKANEVGSPPVHFPAVPEPTPDAYIIWTQTTHCRNCNRFAERSDLFLRYHLRSAWGHRPASNLRPLNGTPMYNLPIIKMQRPLDNTPFCHICATPTTLSHLPPPPRDDTRILANTHEAGRGEEATEGSAPPRTKAKPTISDLIF